MNKKLLASALSLAMLLSSTAALAEEIGDLPESDEPLVQDTWGYEWNYEDVATWSTPSWSDPAVEGDTATAAMNLVEGKDNAGNIIYTPYNSSSVSGKEGKGMLITGSVYGNPSQTVHNNKAYGAWGNKYLVNDSAGNVKGTDYTEVLVSTDFMVPRDGVGGRILVPHINYYNHGMAFSIELDGTMKMINGCRWGGDDGYNITLGKVTYGEWYNLMIKYTFNNHTSPNTGGVHADVYINGELVAPNFFNRFASGQATDFYNNIIAETRHRAIGRSHAVDEGIFFDNTYIGNDMSRIPTETAIARAYDGDVFDKTKLNVRFTKDVKDTLTAADFSVYTATGDAAATVNAIEWLDNREAVLSLSAKLAPYTDYIVGVTGNLSKSFKTKLEGFWNFDDGKDPGFFPNPRTYGNGYVKPGTDALDSYNVTGKGIKAWYGGQTPERSDSLTVKNVAGASPFDTTAMGAYTGSLMINVDVMIPNEFVQGGIVFSGQAFGDMKGNVSFRHTFDSEGTYTGTNLYIDNTVLKTGLELKKWYNLSVAVTNLSSKAFAVDKVYLDGELLTSGSTVMGTAADRYLNGIQLVGHPRGNRTGAVTDEFAYFDNLYVGQNFAYTNSKSKFDTADGLNWTISAGAMKNAGTMLVAVYDADTGALKEVKSAKFDVDPMESADATFALTDTTGTMKLFTWDNVEGLKPFVSPNAAFVTVE